MLEVAVGATMRCKITTRLQPPKGVLQLMLTNGASCSGGCDMKMPGLNKAAGIVVIHENCKTICQLNVDLQT